MTNPAWSETERRDGSPEADGMCEHAEISFEDPRSFRQSKKKGLPKLRDGIKERSFSFIQKYRYGFNGKENNGDISNDNYDFGARIYDARLGRWLAVDPLTCIASYQTPFNYVDNCPTIYTDKNGETRYLVIRVFNEETGISSEIRIVKNDDLKKTVKWTKETTKFLWWTVTSEVKDKVEWTDIDEVTTITIDKNGKKTENKSEEDGQIRYTNSPIMDDLGINDTQEDVNEELAGSNKGWGGINWTWSMGQGGETRKGQGKIRTEDISKIMDCMTAISIGEFNIPKTLLNQSDFLTIANVFQKSITKSETISSNIETEVKQIKALKKTIEDWKSKNLVQKCRDGWIYDLAGNVLNRDGIIPKGKKLSKDEYKCTAEK